MNTNQKSSTLYNKVWREGLWDDMIRYSPAPKHRRRLVLSFLKSISNFKSLIDIGCGSSEMLSIIGDHFPQVKLAGVDISTVIIEKNRCNYPQNDYFHLNIEEASISKTFDVVVCIDVLEHCQNIKDALEHLCNMANKYLIIMVPCGPIFPIDKKVGHIYHLRRDELKILLKERGFNMIKACEWGFPFFNLYKYFINLRPNFMMEHFCSKNKYTFFQKLISYFLYMLFFLNFSFGGYQLAIVSTRENSI